MNETLTSNEWIQRAFGEGGVSPDFSKRFQVLLDHCGFSTGRGRAVEAIQFFEKSRSVMYRCLSDDQCPKDITGMLERLFNTKKMPAGIDQRDVAVWLITGEQNPFNKKSNQYVVNQKHSELMRRVIAVVNKEAEKSQIDLAHLNNMQIIALYQEILTDMMDRNSTTPSAKLIRKALLA